MDASFKKVLIGMAAGAFGVAMVGCGGNAEAAESAEESHTAGGEASCSGEGSCSGATEGGEGGEASCSGEGSCSGAEEGGESSCGAGSCGS